MRLPLKGFQQDAAVRVVAALHKASLEYAEDGELTAVSLSAPTGGGKTVIATAVIEQILFGDEFGTESADPDAIFLWLTDDPALNEQTRKKMLFASDRLQPRHFVTIDESFDAETLDNGKIYFLNIQKLSRNATLAVRREGRVSLMWETLTETIRAKGPHYYLIRDEAHRGVKDRSDDELTIAKRVVDGDADVSPTPVVLGISATPGEFERSVGARTIRKIPVPLHAVRESGLLKEVLAIWYEPDGDGLDNSLVRNGVARLAELDAAWNRYTDHLGQPPVRPLLVLQVPPGFPDSEIGAVLDVCADEWQELAAPQAMVHCLEDHRSRSFGRHELRYVPPQDIQDDPSVRLVVFKERLATGWDCPRAEVMVSLRSATKPDYIEQLIGRMLRAPLGRRVATDESLNAVHLLLPRFKRREVTRIKDALEASNGGLATTVEVGLAIAERNRELPDEVFSLVESLPSYQVPDLSQRSQVARLHLLAALLAADNLVKDAVAESDAVLIDALDDERKKLEDDNRLDEVVASHLTRRVEVLRALQEQMEVSTETITVDESDLEEQMTGARRLLRDGLADTFWRHRVLSCGDESTQAKALILGLSQDARVVARLETIAGERVRDLLASQDANIRQFSDDQVSKYDEVRAMVVEPELSHLRLPVGPISMPKEEGQEFPDHLYVGESGGFRVHVGEWESHVLDVEMQNPNFLAWYRNVPGARRSLVIPYQVANGWGRLYPDFIVVSRDERESLSASIVDPHGQWLGDAGDKLRGLAAYAARHAAAFARVVSVIRMTDGTYRYLDMLDSAMPERLETVNSPESVEQTFLEFGHPYR